MSRKQCVIVGAGMVGISTALALQDAGFDVTVIDKQAPGSETSYGNAGIIQAEAVEPYAFPRNLVDVARAAFGHRNQIAWELTSAHTWLFPLWQYFKHSSPSSYRRISEVYARLIGQATKDHLPLIERSGAAELITKSGYRQAYRDFADFEASIKTAERLHNDFGVESVVEDESELSRAEANLLNPLQGAIRWTDAWTCNDPQALVGAYADLFEANGGLLLSRAVFSLNQTGYGWTMKTSEGTYSADHVVLALGPWTPKFLRPLGYRVPMLMKRGYHVHCSGIGPSIPIMDVDSSTVIAPMQKGVRVLTGAEFNALGATRKTEQIERSLKAARGLFALGHPIESEPWLGTRPCLPRMLPVVGRAPNHNNLWLNFGHGHQGFTLGPTTGRLLAEQMSGAPFESQLADNLRL